MAQFYSAKRRVTTRRTVTVTIHELDAFGQGVARWQGKTLFVSGALPGEEADVLLLEEKRQWARGQVKTLHHVSPERVAPQCPWFTLCGGCQQQHVATTLQQRSKAQALSRLLTQETGQQVTVDHIISGDAYGYRRRARFGLQYQPDKKTLLIGFRKAASSDLVDIDRCAVLRPELNALLPPLRECLQQLQASRRPGHAELVLADNGPLLVLRHIEPLSAADREKLERFSQIYRVALFLAAQSDMLEQVSGEEPFYRLDDLQLVFSPRDFIQINDGVNQQMVVQALAWLDLQPDDRLLDLFCGMGNFTLPAAKMVASVTGVEGSAALVRQARENARRNGLDNVTFCQASLTEEITHQPWAAERFNKILLDPSRAGAAGVMQHIARLAASHVVYVSCNPATLARDSQQLLAAGYRLDKVAMIDMFPHTGHLESVVLFSKA